MYRIHARCDEVPWDATHLRPIAPEGLRMFNRERSRDVIERWNPETPLGLYTDADFDFLELKSIWLKPWSRRLAEGKASE
jgi:hypothetical protein